MDGQFIAQSLLMAAFLGSNPASATCQLLRLGYLTTQCLNCIICKIRIAIVPTPQNNHMD